VVGAGVVGLSVAWQLATRGVAVTVWDAGHPGGGASGRAHGQVVPPAAALVPLWRESLRLYQELAEMGEFGWDRRPIGTLVLAWTPDELDLLGGRDGTGDGRRLDGAAVRELEPAVSQDVVGGLALPEGRRIDPTLVVATLALAARRAGASLRTGEPVVDLVPAGERGWRLVTAGGLVADHRAVVLAAGAGTAALAGRAGRNLPIVGVRGRILLTEPLPPLLGRLLADCRLGTATALAAARPFLGTLRGPNDHRPSVALLAHQRADGRVVLGASWSPDGDGDPGDHRDLDARIARNALNRLPGLADARIERTWSGVRPCSPDGRPVVGRVAPGLYVCCGHGGEGFIAGPGTASLLADLVLHRPPYTDPRPFSADRFLSTDAQGAAS